MNRPAPWRSLTAGLIDRRPFRVGGATVDPVSRDASWTSGHERLQPQILKVLLVLHSRQGEVVTRDELVQLCWDGRIVGDDVINRAISLLRHLAEHAGGFEIETVPRTGYRLIETKAVVRASNAGGWLAGAAALLVLVGGVGAWSWFNQPPVKQGVPPVPSISVVPFTAAGTDPLVRQVAQAAPTSLSHMLSESGFAIVRADAGGDNPRSDFVFSGSIRRTAATIDATVQMVSRRDGTIAFDHDFSVPLDHSADLPDQIGATAAAELAWTGAEMVLDPREHLDPEVASELMKAISLTIEQGDSMRSYQLVRHAAPLAPNSAIAQLTLAVTTAFSLPSIPHDERNEALATARRAGDRARALAPEFGDVYIVWCLLHSPVRIGECEDRLRHAAAVDPSSSFVPGYQSAIFASTGRVDESVQLARQSLANDPYKPAKLARMVRTLEADGRHDEADAVYRQAIRLWPGTGRIRASRIQGLAEGGDYADLGHFVDPRVDAPMLDPTPLAALIAAEQKHDLASAQRACANAGLKPFTLSLCMNILADLGDRDRAFAKASILYPVWHAAPGTDPEQFWLDHPDGYSTAILAGAGAQGLRTDPRFLDLEQKLGVLDYWRTHGMPDFCTKTREPECAKIAGK